MKEALHAVLKKARGFRQVKWKKRRAELERLEAKHGRDRSLAVNFQEVVHSAQTVNADVAKHTVIRRGAEWTLTRMRL